MILLEKDVLQAAGSLQLCGGQIAGSEPVIHGIHDIFNNDNTEGILQRMQRMPLIRSIEKLCFTT